MCEAREERGLSHIQSESGGVPAVGLQTVETRSEGSLHSYPFIWVCVCACVCVCLNTMPSAKVGQCVAIGLCVSALGVNIMCV